MAPPKKIRLTLFNNNGSSTNATYILNSSNSNQPKTPNKANKKTSFRAVARAVNAAKEMQRQGFFAPYYHNINNKNYNGNKSSPVRTVGKVAQAVKRFEHLSNKNARPKSTFNYNGAMQIVGNLQKNSRNKKHKLGQVSRRRRT